MPKSRQYILISLTALLFTAVSLIVHVISPSSLHQTDDNWNLRVSVHRHDPAFAGRPVTTALVVGMHSLFGWSLRTAFFVLQFILMLLSGPVMFAYLRQLGLSFRYSAWGMVIYYLSLPVFLAHFDPVYTWDDFWVYLAIPMSFAFILRRQLACALLSFVFAILARETSLIFLPVWFAAIRTVDRRRLVRPLVLSLTAVLVYIGLRFILSETALGKLEWKVAFNFDGWLRTRDTVFSLLVSLGFLWPVGWYQVCRERISSIAHPEIIRFGAVVTAAGYVISTLLFAQARETRLFFPPFVFFIPLALLYFQTRAEAIGRFAQWPVRPGVMAVTAGSIIVGIFVAMVLFPDFEFRTWKDGNRAFFGLHLAATLLCAFIHRPGRRLPEN